MFPISIDNLLGRNIVPPVMELMSQAINGNCICITGAGGSIGSELCRQINNLNPKKIVLIDNSELNLYLKNHVLNQAMYNQILKMK